MARDERDEGSDGESGERAFTVLDEGIGRRDLLRAAALIGTGAVAPAWLAGCSASDAPRSAGRTPATTILQPGEGPRPGRYVPSTPDSIRWGYLPNRDAAPVATVQSGSVVTLDAVSHEGILEDQGRDPLGYFAGHGVPEREVMRDARAIADSGLEHSLDDDGPHVVTGPVDVVGARPGDALKIEVLALRPRTPYGVISNRHGKGALPGEFPENSGPLPGASAQRPERFRNVSTFTPVVDVGGRGHGMLPVRRGLSAQFPLDPFMGMMGVALDTSARVDSVPPTKAGGNIDIKNLTVGSKLYLPVFVPGAKFFVGDSHYAQGHGEVALTALEAPLRGTFRLTTLKAGSREVPAEGGRLTMPFGETAEYWMPVGLNADLDAAMKQSVRQAISFLGAELDMPRATAYAYLSAATDFVVSQVVDGTKGVHGLIRRADFVRT
jgi:acetamidase/formamidase